MRKSTILYVPKNAAVRHAGIYLSENGFQTTTVPAPDVGHVILPIPSSAITDEYLAHLLAELPDDVIICGGNLSSPLLEGYATVDFLQDPYYLAENAAITAKCARHITESKLGPAIRTCSVLIVGWGRIGKCLCSNFRNAGSHITVAARKHADRAMIRALGGRSISLDEAICESPTFDVIINTVPAMVLPNIKAHENALILELASVPGISGKNITDCRGLPGKMAPEESGKLIAKTFLRLVLSKEE